MVEQQSILTAFVASVLALALFGAFYIGTEDYLTTGYAIKTIRVIGEGIKDAIERETTDLMYKDSFHTILFNQEKPINISINRADIALMSVLIKTDTEIRAFYTNISSKLTHPNSSKIYYDEIYQFFNIINPKIEKNTTEIELIFRVARWWMKDNYVYDDTIKLRQFKQGAWRYPDMELIGKSDEYYLFKAKPTSIGEFAIVGRKEEPAKIEERVVEKPKTIEVDGGIKIMGIDIKRFAELYWQFIVFPLMGLLVFVAGYRYIVRPLKGVLDVYSAKADLRMELKDQFEKKKQIILNERRKLEILVEYIKKARQHRSDDWIMASAMLKGWPRKTVEKAFKLTDKK